MPGRKRSARCCTLCGREFSTYRGLSKHVLGAHDLHYQGAGRMYVPFRDPEELRARRLALIRGQRRGRSGDLSAEDMEAYASRPGGDCRPQARQSRASASVSSPSGLVDLSMGAVRWDDEGMEGLDGPLIEFLDDPDATTPPGLTPSASSTSVREGDRGGVGTVEGAVPSVDGPRPAASSVDGPCPAASSIDDQQRATPGCVDALSGVASASVGYWSDGQYLPPPPPTAELELQEPDGLSPADFSVEVRCDGVGGRRVFRSGEGSGATGARGVLDGSGGGGGLGTGGPSREPSAVPASAGCSRPLRATTPPPVARGNPRGS